MKTCHIRDGPIRFLRGGGGVVEQFFVHAIFFRVRMCTICFAMIKLPDVFFLDGAWFLSSARFF